MFALMLAAGLVLPILVELTASRYGLTRALLLGQKILQPAGMQPLSKRRWSARGDLATQDHDSCSIGADAPGKAGPGCRDSL